ncbi:hypothetical protein BJ508DRAFT_337042 [Ascobolus immersus RN42]|uniref:Uncharacterized protein n=1 Tax=Ascobolus immersus RN42 TaxID=1160509 RepID=A0A3N4HBH3_ASCIM|nr:hypothetical protein BJ508DRAFT_337042 [Ascobolus immersus RN42]
MSFFAPDNLAIRILIPSTKDSRSRPIHNSLDMASEPDDITATVTNGHAETEYEDIKAVHSPTPEYEDIHRLRQPTTDDPRGRDSIRRLRCPTAHFENIRQAPAEPTYPFDPLPQ